MKKLTVTLFAAQAEQYGFDKEEYLAAFDSIPRFSREEIQDLMVFYSRMSEWISKISHANLKLANPSTAKKSCRENSKKKLQKSKSMLLKWKS